MTAAQGEIIDAERGDGAPPRQRHRAQQVEPSVPADGLAKLAGQPGPAAAAATVPGRLPSREFAINQAWCTAAAIPADLIAWLQIHAPPERPPIKRRSPG
jgi:hypothetical protein